MSSSTASSPDYSLSVPDGLQVICAANIEAEPIEWLWPNRIPLGKLSCFAGNPDVGKSMVSIDIAARVTTGRAWPDAQKNINPASDVVLLGAEDGYADTVRPRLEAAGADLRRVHILDSMVREHMSTSKRLFGLDDDVRKIQELLKNNPQIKLLIIDPISSYLGKKTNMNSEQDVRQAITPLSDAIKDTGCAALYIAHFNKSSDVAAIHRIGGAVGIAGLARAAWVFAKDGDDEELRLMLRIKNNIAKDVGGLCYRFAEVPIASKHGPISVPVVRWEGKTAKTADGVLAASPMKREGDATRAEEWLREYMPQDGREIPATTVEKEAARRGFKPTTLHRAKDVVGIESVKHGAAWYWRRPVEAES